MQLMSSTCQFKKQTFQSINYLRFTQSKEEVSSEKKERDFNSNNNGHAIILNLVPQLTLSTRLYAMRMR